MIQTPMRGAPITAAWARKVTDAANAYNESSVKRRMIVQGIKLDSASEHAFKVKVLEQASEGKPPKFSIYLPPNSVMWGMTALDAKGAMKEAEIEMPKTGEGGAQGGNEQGNKVNIDGRFKHCYVFEAESGEWTKETKKIAGEMTIYKGEIYCVILEKNAAPAVSFLIAKDSDDLTKQKENLGKTGNLLAMFCVARLDENGIEQITKGAMAYGGASGGDVVLCQIAGGTAEHGYYASFYGNGRNAPSTGSGKVYMTEIALGTELPIGTWVLGHPLMIQITGGGEE